MNIPIRTTNADSDIAFVESFVVVFKSMVLGSWFWLNSLSFVLHSLCLFLLLVGCSVCHPQSCQNELSAFDAHDCGFFYLCVEGRPLKTAEAKVWVFCMCMCALCSTCSTWHV